MLKDACVSLAKKLGSCSLSAGTLAETLMRITSADCSSIYTPLRGEWRARNSRESQAKEGRE